jgi:hypothetical protein
VTLEPSGATPATTPEPAALAAEMEATRERLAQTIDQLVYRASPKTIVRREITSVKGYFVDLESGQPRTGNILRVVGSVVGVVVLFAIVRKVASD